MMKLTSLWRSPELNSANGKALTIPIFNVIDIYGRCFHLAWLGFFVAFLSWFAFPPLMSDIAKDIHLTPKDISNANIVGLCSTLLTRFALGPLCDLYGPRVTMSLTLLAGAIPTAFVPLVSSKAGIFAIRFFIGILGGTFVPCQYWCTTFFDKSVVGRANALAGGWGNAGGGVAFFSMPAIMNGFHKNGYSLSHSWKYSFVVFPMIIIILVAMLCLLLGQDCPEGKWSDRTTTAQIMHGTEVEQNTYPSSQLDNEKQKEPQHEVVEPLRSPVHPRLSAVLSHGIQSVRSAPSVQALSAVKSRMQNIGAHEDVHVLDTAEIIEKPTVLSTLKTAFHYSTFITALPYATTFGGELAVESIIAALYAAHARKVGEQWSSTLAGDWGSMLGLLNVITRPLGGYISDILYHRFKTPSVKRYWILVCGLLEGVFLLYIGLYKSISMPGLIVSVAFMCVFMEMGNGANFSLVPHLNPHHTGIVAGTTGSLGNVGGILLSLAFRFSLNADGTTDYQDALWHIGIAIMGVNILCAAIPFGPTLER